MREKVITQAMTIRPSDTVLHKPSGEKWLIVGAHHDGREVVPGGYPFPTIAQTKDCELLESGNMPQEEEWKVALRKHGLVNFIEATLEYVGEGQTSIIMKDAVPFEEACKIRDYVAENYQTYQIDIHGVQFGDVQTGHVVKAGLNGYYKAENDSSFVKVGPYWFYIGTSSFPYKKRPPKVCEKCGHEL